ncbi:MAG: hypothetical protein KBC21_04365 [Candidatus Pacebacteria bacterium]|nr:hypothetical protein [Candidatus Paceibacterota bacterium]
MAEIITPIHLLILAFTVWQIISADHFGIKWITGKVKVLDLSLVKKYHNRTWLGLVLMITTGVILFLPEREALLSKPQFIVKMGFVVALVINGFFIGFLQNIATTKTFASLTFKEKMSLIISGTVSTLSWLGATVAGLLLDSD